MMSTSEITVAFLDVGQGDASVIILPDHTSAIIIDCSRSQVVIDYLEKKGIDTLNRVFLTHSDQDHIDGIVELIQNFVEEMGPICSLEYNHDTSLIGGNRKFLLRHIAQLV